MTARSHPSARLAAFLAVAFAAPVPASAQRGAPTYPQVHAAGVVPEYAEVLRALDPANPESILKARDAALAKYAKAANADADVGFRQFQAFYDKVVDDIVTRLRASGGGPTRELVDFLRAESTDPYFKDWLRGTDRWLSGR